MPYLNVTEVESGLIGLAGAYPDLTELITLPNTTYEGRTCHALRIGTGTATSKDGVLFIGGQHAREWGSCEICLNFATDLLEAYTQGTGLVCGGKTFTASQIRFIVESLNVFVFPLVNPDGRNYSQTAYSLWRKNRRPITATCIGVDINRNYDFLWDFINLFSPSSTASSWTSYDPCNLTYHGPAPFSESETQNVRWLLETYPRIRWFVDIHSYSQLILYPWGDDENQTTDPSMNFMNHAYNNVRGIDGDTAYKEYIPPDDLMVFKGQGNRVRDAILAVRGKNYTVEQSFDLYPTSGTSDDYVYSRCFTDPSKNKVYGFTIEWGMDFQPPWDEMELIILDITSGLLEFCLAVPCKGDLIAVNLDTPALNFNDVPEGETTVRAAVFSVNSCKALTFQITSGPTVTSGPPGTSFGIPLGPTVSLDTSLNSDTRYAHVWISYTGTHEADTASGTVTIKCNETGNEWTIPITANTIRRPTAAVMLVLDKSNSMNFPSGFSFPLLSRNDVLKYSAFPFMELIHDNDAVGIVSFDHDAYDVMPLTQVGLPSDGRRLAKDCISAHAPNPLGWTSIGDGVELAHPKLISATGYDTKATLVFTDGHENRPKFLADISDVNERVYAIALGTAEEIQPAALTTLTNGTGGYLLLTGALDEDRLFQMSKYFLQILAGIRNLDIVVDPEGRILPGQVHRLPFYLNEADITSDIILLTPAPLAVKFSLETPAGEVINSNVDPAAVGASFFAGTNVAFYRLTLPLRVGAGARAGKWTAVLTVDDKRLREYLATLKVSPEAYASVMVHGLRYALTVHAYSNLRLRVDLSQNSYEPGATLKLRAILTENSLPLETGAKVEVELTRPDNTSSVAGLQETEKGIFETAVNTTFSGVYGFRVRAQGSTLRGLRFTREQEITGAVWKGGDNPPPSEKDYPDKARELLCRLLTCLLSSKNISPELEKNLAKLGLNLAGVRRCLKEFCTDMPPGEVVDRPS